MGYALYVSRIIIKWARRVDSNHDLFLEMEFYMLNVLLSESLFISVLTIRRRREIWRKDGVIETQAFRLQLRSKQC